MRLMDTNIVDTLDKHETDDVEGLFVRLAEHTAFFQRDCGVGQ